MAQARTRTILIGLLSAFILVIALFAYSTVKSLKEITSFAGNDHEHFSGSGNIALMKIESVIMSGEEALKKIEEIEKSKSIKALVLKINSPGGAVAPSQEIYDALIRLRSKKVVVCALGDVAASGGYYIAAACEKIIAMPGTLTGSIGVIMHFMNLKDLYAWAKVKPNIIKAGKFKDVGNQGRDMLPEERALLENMINEIHKQFKDAILAGRNGKEKQVRLKPEDLEAYADGRIFSGAFARDKGFVDDLGGEFEAIKVAQDLAKIEEVDLIREDDDENKFRSFFDSKSSIDRSVDSVMSSLMKSLNQILPLGIQPGVPYLLPAYIFQQSGEG